MKVHVPAGLELAIYADDTTPYCQIASADEVEKVNQTLQTAVDAIQDRVIPGASPLSQANLSLSNYVFVNSMMKLSSFCGVANGCVQVNTHVT